MKRAVEDDLLYNALALSKQRVAALKAISKAVLKNATISAEMHTLLDTLFVRLESYIWKADDHRELAARFPATWWDAFKLRWFPRWAELRWPSNYKEVWATTSILYPDLILPDQRYATMLTFDYKGCDADAD